ncbi:MAG: hypothetical protein EOO74_03395, partial [Myxococcales bacterium]
LSGMSPAPTRTSSHRRPARLRRRVPVPRGFSKAVVRPKSRPWPDGPPACPWWASLAEDVALAGGGLMPSVVDTVERFWSKVQKGDGCWEWQGWRNDNGYGLLMSQGKAVRAHRLAWVFENGPIPDGLFVCHHCDNPPCVRLDHLFLGTNTDNMVDMVRKGRARPVRGEHNSQSKLTEAQVLEIFERVVLGESTRSIAQSLGVHQGTIDAALSGKTWAQIRERVFASGDVAAAVAKKLSRRGEDHRSAKLTAEQVRDAFARRATGETLTQIGAALGVHFSTAGRILAGKTWSHLDLAAADRAAPEDIKAFKPTPAGPAL